MHLQPPPILWFIDHQPNPLQQNQQKMTLFMIAICVVEDYNDY